MEKKRVRKKFQIKGLTVIGLTVIIYFVVRKCPAHADVAEWQTHKTQNLAGATSCGFKSHHPHTAARNRTIAVHISRRFYVADKRHPASQNYDIFLSLFRDYVIIEKRTGADGTMDVSCGIS